MLSKKSQNTEAANFPLKDKTSGVRHCQRADALHRLYVLELHRNIDVKRFFGNGHVKAPFKGCPAFSQRGVGVGQ
jgi:hypothetical protein